MPRRAAVLPLALVCCSMVLPSCSRSGPTGSAADGGEIHTQSLKAYLAFPVGYDSTLAYPLLVALHGNGGSAADFAPVFTPFKGESLVVALAQGEYARSDGGYSWYYETNDPRLWEPYDRRSMNTLVELIGAIRARYRIGKVFVLGFSQGASLAYLTGLMNPPLVTGVLAIAGGLPEVDEVGSIVHSQDVAAARGVRVFIARGFADAAMPHEAFVAQRDFFTANGYEVTALEFAGGHYFTADLVAGIRQWLRERAR